MEPKEYLSAQVNQSRAIIIRNMHIIAGGEFSPHFDEAIKIYGLIVTGLKNNYDTYTSVMIQGLLIKIEELFNELGIEAPHNEDFERNKPSIRPATQVKAKIDIAANPKSSFNEHLLTLTKAHELAQMITGEIKEATCSNGLIWEADHTYMNRADKKTYQLKTLTNIEAGWFLDTTSESGRQQYLQFNQFINLKRKP